MYSRYHDRPVCGWYQTRDQSVRKKGKNTGRLHSWKKAVIDGMMTRLL